MTNTYNPLSGMVKDGAILCNKCQKPMKDREVCVCGNNRCFVVVFHGGRHWYFRKDPLTGKPFHQDRAVLFLANYNQEKSRCNQAGIPFDPSQYTDKAIRERFFEHQFERYLQEKAEDLRCKDIGQEHYRHIEGYYRNYYGFFAGKDVLVIWKDIKPLVTEFQHSLLGKNKTKRNIVNNLKAFFTWLAEEGVIPTAPTFPKLKIRNDAKRTVALRPEQQEGALENIPAEHRDVFQLMMKTGLRPSEVVAILVSSVDVENRVIWVDQRRSGTVYRPGSKNEQDSPFVPLNATALEIAKKHKKGKFPKDFLFVHPTTGKPYTQWFLSDLWRRMSESGVTLYEGTRHSFCSNMPKLTDRRTAQRLMRHKDARSTDNYYHAYAENLLEVVDQMDNVRPLKKRAKNNDE